MCRLYISCSQRSSAEHASSTAFGFSSSWTFQQRSSSPRANVCSFRVPSRVLHRRPSSRIVPVARLSGDDLPFAQPRADLLAVISAGTLILYGLTRVEVTDRTRVAVDMGGVEVRSGFEGGSTATSFAEWAASTIFAAAPAFKSFALVVGGEEVCKVGRFRDEEVKAGAPPGGIAAGAAESGKRAYLADLKVVPVRETEFAFLPEMCQSVVVQPLTANAVLILGADTPRPLTGSDFGWLQAIGDKLAQFVE